MNMAGEEAEHHHTYTVLKLICGWSKTKKKSGKLKKCKNRFRVAQKVQNLCKSSCCMVTYYTPINQNLQIKEFADESEFAEEILFLANVLFGQP